MNISEGVTPFQACGIGPTRGEGHGASIPDSGQPEGVGRELGYWGIEDYLEVKHIYINLEED